MSPPRHQWLPLLGALCLAALAAALFPPRAPAPAEAPPLPAGSVSILVDDFRRQPAPGEEGYPFNRIGGDRGALGESQVAWGQGQALLTVAPGAAWGGAWMSLNHPAHEGLPVNFAALLPPPIAPAYQSRVTGITVQIARGTPGRALRIELKDGDQLRWAHTIRLRGGRQAVSVDLPALGAITQLAWVLDHAEAGDQVAIQRIALSATAPIGDTALTAFVWSYAMLLNNWSPATGLVRDKATDAGGAFDAIQATGSLAAATAQAAQLGVVGRADAIQVVSRISRVLLEDLPRLHGLWPHFVQVEPTGTISIAPGTEWSSVDTVIAAVGLLTARHALGLETAGVEARLRAIDWERLRTPAGLIAHGYAADGGRLGAAWDVFGGESWLVALAYAGATGRVTPLAYPLPPTANGSGFIDELAWLYIAPPPGLDVWGGDWAAYRSAAASRQIAHFTSAHPASCPAQLGLFGLSAAESPTGATYEAYGVGGQFAGINDGEAALGAPVVVPHYAALAATLRPHEALALWGWLIRSGAFSPLNAVESLAFPRHGRCTADLMIWSELKGSWNLALQTLGWGRYLAERAGQAPALWAATAESPLLRAGYRLLAPMEPTPSPAGPSSPLAVYSPRPGETATTPVWDHAQAGYDWASVCPPSLAGSYLYRVSTNGNSVLVLTPASESIPENPALRQGVPPTGAFTTQSIGVEPQRGALGTFQAARVETTNTYSFVNPYRHDVAEGAYRQIVWRVCRLGLVHSVATHTGTFNRAPFQLRFEVTLVSFTPASTSEAHVRYILADIQLGQLADAYRAACADEETAEALRRWDAGMRATNIHQFERRVIDGQWRIVDAGTTNPIDGAAVGL